jgi:hypothetical protein
MGSVGETGADLGVAGERREASPQQAPEMPKSLPRPGPAPDASVSGLVQEALSLVERFRTQRDARGKEESSINGDIPI